MIWLDVDQNKVSDLEPLSGLRNLIWLDVDQNKVSDLEPLSGLTNLIWLDVNQNKVSDLAPLSGLSRNTYTNLEYNQITDWTTARNIRNIQGNVSISAAKVLREDLLARVKSLEKTPRLYQVFYSDALKLNIGNLFINVI